MVTLVGTQTDFSNAMIQLLELEYDANEAYQAAIDRLKNEIYLLALKEFKSDHDRHLAELKTLLRNHNVSAPEKADMKQWLTKGKVVIAGMMGDLAILKAMQTNEEDTNVAYERIYNHKDIWDDAVDIIKRNFDDEKRHKAWLEETISKAQKS